MKDEEVILDLRQFINRLRLINTNQLQSMDRSFYEWIIREVFSYGDKSLFSSAMFTFISDAFEDESDTMLGLTANELLVQKEELYDKVKEMLKQYGIECWEVIDFSESELSVHIRI